MKHSRKDYLESCQVCGLRSFDPRKGVICSLTNEHAAYQEEECPNFELDPIADKKSSAAKALKEIEQVNSETLGLAKWGIKNQLVAGIVVIVLSIAWIIIGLFFDRIFYYPFILIIIGIVVAIKGFMKEVAKANKKKAEQNSLDILDSDL